MAGTIVADTIQNGAGTSTSMTNAISGSAKAWVNFDGTTSPGTIRASYNVSSITKTATGDYVVNFTNAFADANYATVSSSGRNGSSGGYLSLVSDKTAQTTTTVQLYTITTSGTVIDTPYVSVAVFR